MLRAIETKEDFFMGKAKTQRIIANVMALALAVSAIPFASKVEVNAQPDTQEDDLTRRHF